MRILWLLLLILAVCLVLTECRRNRKRKHRRTKTTTTPAPVVEEKEEEEEEENEEVTPWEGVSEDQASLADDFFKDFDEDNIVDSDEEPPYINKPEVVDFFAAFPRRRQQLIEKEMFEEKQKKSPLQDGEWNKRVNLVDSLFYRNLEIGAEKRVNALVMKRQIHISQILKLYITLSPNTQTFGDVDVELKDEPNGVPGKCTVSSKMHGWDPESFSSKKKSVINLGGSIGEIYLRNIGYFKEYTAKLYSSKMCIEMYLYNHLFGSVVCFEIKGTSLTNIQSLTLINSEMASLWTVYDKGTGFDDLETYAIEKSMVEGKKPVQFKKTPLNDQELYRKYLKNK